MSGIKATGDRLVTVEIWRDHDGSIRGRLRNVEPGVFCESPADLQARLAQVADWTRSAAAWFDTEAEKAGRG